MEFLFGLLLLGLIVGLFVRKKGDSFTDTLQLGCSSLVGIIFFIICIIILIFIFAK